MTKPTADNPSAQPQGLPLNDLLGPIVLNIHFGTVECRAWLEADMMPDGTLRLVGMGSRTDYDRDGNVTAHKCEPTGAIAYWPAPEPRRSWLARVLTPNAKLTGPRVPGGLTRSHQPPPQP